MKIGKIGNRRQLVLLGILGGILVLALVKWGGSSAKKPEAAPPAAGRQIQVDGAEVGAPRPRVRSGEKTVSPEDVPDLTVKDLEPPRGRKGPESARNIFDFRQPTVPPLPTPTPPPPPPPPPGSQNFVGPMPPPPPTPTPLPPDIPFKFIGTFGPKDRPIAVLVLQDQTINARAGDVVFDRFIVRRVGYESIDIGFVGPWTDTRRLGITP